MGGVACCLLGAVDVDAVRCVCVVVCCSLFLVCGPLLFAV